MEKGLDLRDNQPVSLQGLIERSCRELGRALPNHMKPERLVRIALTCIRLNPKLSECTPESFLGALFASAQIGIEPIAGRAYLIPFNNKRKIGNEYKWFKEVQFVMGYSGYVELFYRHEKAVQLSWGIVKSNDDFDYCYGTGAYVKHKPSLKNQGETIGYYVIAKLNNGGEPFMFMSKEDCLIHGNKHSKAVDKEGKFYKESPWITDVDAMCLKTVLLQMKKLLPLSVEIQRAFEVDETSRDYRQGIDSAMDIPSNTSWEKAEIVENDKKKKEEKQEAKTDSKYYLLRDFQIAKKELGEKKYYEILGKHGFEKSNEIEKKEKKEEILKEMMKLCNKK